jgi:hypothetical protein
MHKLVTALFRCQQPNHYHPVVVGIYLAGRKLPTELFFQPFRQV